MISTLLIIDAMNLVRRIYAVQQKQHGDTPTALIATQSTTTNALKKLLRIHQPTHAICVFDSHAPSWRHQIYPEYKQGRKPIPELLKQGLPAIQEQFFDLGIDSLVTEEDEADDLIACLADKIAKQQQKCIIVSTDKGFYQLLNESIQLYDYFQNSFVIRQQVHQKMGISIQQLNDYWAITGISSSAIKGVEGIGSKGALSLLQQYGSLNNIFQQAEDSNNKLLTKIKSQQSNAILAKQLVTLKTDIKLGFNLKDLRYTDSTD
ncbi:5'-3' exonuclease [Psychromonas ingrahamii 37]|uniref:Flap endonuclease Xni n=1 Tax=Psychromonas ingrahamii (strain DSM 17664 / CCUG 51855 / 37) TaxID=357804 RepID=XNI_PSYIN|nr:flap endonuclease Xni [Psychromonas ingrahamii]A1SYB8.1 RecName: Full=Flap endonuclease Xni; Short=FEN [Psychromonas ingrahamii 37]ABM04483.1 5'-3' exonuclease [Psychromonas ingrahamii 37]